MTGAYVKDRVAVRPNPRALDARLAAEVDAITRALVVQTILPSTTD
jgi:hypothetical protein